MLQKLRILCIGAGRMATAIVAGLVKNDSNGIVKIVISNRANHERLLHVRDAYGVGITNHWQTEVSGSDVILLAIPPDQHPLVLKELASLVDKQLVITVAAGIGIQFLEDHLPYGTPVAWVMPNTAADIGESMSIYALGNHVTDKHHEILEMILGGIGDFEKFPEQQIQDLTAITGSAPAFIYQIADIFEKISIEFGLSELQARKLVVQMMYGSARMLQQGISPVELADQVTSPGGATEAGLKVLAEYNLGAILKDAIHAVNARANELKN